MRRVVLAASSLVLVSLLASSAKAWDGECAFPMQATAGAHPQSVIEHYHVDMDIYIHDEDWWVLTLPPNHAATARLTTSGNNYVLGYVFAQSTSACPGPSVVTLSGLAQFSPVNTTSQAVNYLINVHANGGGWNAYSLDVQLQPMQGCATGGFVDSFEPNSLLAPRTLTPNVYGPMSCAVDDTDVFTVRVPPGARLTARTSFQNATGDLDLYMIGPMGQLSVTGTQNVETLTWTSNLTFSTSPLVKVQAKVAPLPVFGCNQYVLDLTVDSPNMGTVECTSTRNSRGLAATLRGYGSRSVAQNNLFMAADGMPGSAPCVLFAGTTAAQVPFGAGYLCVAAPRVRLFQGVAATAGTADMHADLQAPGIQTSAVAGATFHFQTLYRDPQLLGGFNLTDAFAVTFTP